ncbi:DoxX family protein [Chryseolinea lacunae]|uniref:DoxX family protein n=1 Tax=Chryseolinea lacunae TaxID=2801331 RepID=A0ABS1KMA5_9BACT|nr:DoxX family protein [Chryseolinea lacunae]MBL0740576.1 DoxX family protein [Chryseolinea lacunae]
MTHQQKPSRIIHIGLWVVQVLLAINLVWAAMVKLFQPIEQLSAMWPWTGQVSVALVKFTGLVDLMGAVGLILPALLRVKPTLIPITALFMIVLMVCASIFHIARGEASLIGVNVVVAVLAAFVAWGRFMKAPIVPK